MKFVVKLTKDIFTGDKRSFRMQPSQRKNVHPKYMEVQILDVVSRKKNVIKRK